MKKETKTKCTGASERDCQRHLVMARRVCTMTVQLHEFLSTTITLHDHFNRTILHHDQMQHFAHWNMIVTYVGPWLKEKLGMDTGMQTASSDAMVIIVGKSDACEVMKTEK
jgi:hypothetical protein